MSAMPYPATSAQNKIPANLILTPRELKHYRRWQRLYTSLKPAEQGYIPTATEYDDFQQWLKRQDSGYFSDIFEDVSDHIQAIDCEPPTSTFHSPVATICRHTMHPAAAGQPRTRCPICTIDVHLNYMKVLSQALEAAGGRAPSCTLTASQHQDTVYSAWCQGKIITLKDLAELEVLAEKEAEWLAAHPETKCDDMQTAARALDLYWSETIGVQEVKPIAKKERTVKFTTDTILEPGRPHAYYWRRSPRYEPGKYAVDVQQDDEAGAISEDSEDYCQERVYHFGPASEAGCEDPAPEVEEPPPASDQMEEPEDDDDTDWEDIDSDAEDSGHGDEESEGSYVYFSAEEESGFIVFADD